MMAGAIHPATESPVSFVIPGDPYPWKRPGFNGHGRFVQVFNKPEHDAYLTRVRAVSHEAMSGRAPFECAVSVSIIARFAVPKSWPKYRRIEALNGFHVETIREDTDNLAKIINDGMNGIVFNDDRQVAPLFADKRYAQVPSVLVRIKPRGAVNV